jgi:hypothetical protein
VPDHRQHRGPHPQDEQLFAPGHWPAIGSAVEHLSWLLTQQYAPASSLKLVGDHFGLDKRQRLAVQRSACSDTARRRRARHCVAEEQVRGAVLDIDGLNLLTTVEAALAGGVLLRGRDGCLRDMASVHGSYRQVAETEPALRAIGAGLKSLGPAQCHWWLDRPVSNSGRLSRLILDMADLYGWPWTTQLVADPDAVLRESPHVVVTADSVILDQVQRWYDLASPIVAACRPHARIVPASTLRSES